MPAPNPTAPQMLTEAILAKAQHDSQEVLRHAEQEAAALLAKAAAEAERLRKDRLNQARAEATRRQELILATVAVETGRQRAAQVEAVLQLVLEEVQHRLRARNGFDYPQTLADLAAEAIAQMSGEEFVVKLSPADRDAFAEGLTEAIARRSGRSSLKLSLLADPAITGAGLTVQAADGHQVWDNGLAARLERLWPEVRRQVAVHAGLVGTNTTAGGCP